MEMTESEIVKSFRKADNKRAQIKILSELNACSKEMIAEVLLRNGIKESELPKKPGKKRAAETEVFSQQIKKSHAKPDEFRSGKPVPEQVKEQVETVALKTTEEILLMEETAEPEAVHVEAPEVRHEVPESVKKACRDRIWGIIQEVAELEREKRELQGFLGESA